MNILGIQKEAENIKYMISLLKEYCNKVCGTEEIEIINYGVSNLSRHADRLCCLINNDEN